MPHVPALSAHLADCARALSAAASTPGLDAAFDRAVAALVAALRAGLPVLVCGNGGSQADAQHIAGELAARFLVRRKGLPVLALGTNVATLTAWGNDEDFVTAFAREVEAYGRPGGVLVAISTSGNSRNVIEAVARAREIGMTVVGLSGGDAGRMAASCDILLSPAVAPRTAAAVQQLHLPIYHLLCERVEAACADL